MKFKGTYVFVVVVAAVVAYGIYDYKQQQVKADRALTENNVLPTDETFQRLSSLKFHGPLGSFQLQKTDGQWTMVNPVQDLADESATRAFFEGVANQNVTKVDVQGNVDLAKYGLDKPEAQWEFEFENGKGEKGKVEKLAVGTVRAFNDGYYIRRNDENVLLLGATGWSPYVNKTSSELRNKQVYPGYGEYKSLALKEGGHSLRFVMDGNNWVYPANPIFHVSQQAVADVANAIRHMRADSIVANENDAKTLARYGLQKPDVLVELEDKNAKGDLHWSAKFSLNKGDAYATTNQSTVIYHVRPEKVKALQVSLIDMKDKEFPFLFDHTHIAAFKFHIPGQPLRLVYKQNGRWQLSIEEPHLRINQDKVAEFLNAIRGLQVARYLPAGKAVSSKKKTEGQGLFIALNAVDKPVFELHWGQDFKDKENAFVYAWTSEANEAFLMNQADLQSVKAIQFLDSVGKTLPGQVDKAGEK